MFRKVFLGIITGCMLIFILTGCATTSPEKLSNDSTQDSTTDNASTETKTIPEENDESTETAVETESAPEATPEPPSEPESDTSDTTSTIEHDEINDDKDLLVKTDEAGTADDENEQNEQVEPEEIPAVISFNVIVAEEHDILPKAVEPVIYMEDTEAPLLLSYQIPESPVDQVSSGSAEIKGLDFNLSEPEEIPVEDRIPETIITLLRNLKLVVHGHSQLTRQIDRMRMQLYSSLLMRNSDLESRNSGLRDTLQILALENERVTMQNSILEKEILQIQSELLAAGSMNRDSVSEGKDKTPDKTEIKHVYAVPNDVIAITLNGNGWVFLGEKTNQTGVAFKARENTDNYTEFIFETGALGEYLLQFRRQDLFTGEDSTQGVHVSVVGTERFAELLNIRKEIPGSSDSDLIPSPRGFILADIYYSEGKIEKALHEYLKNYIEGNHRINQQIADLSFQLQDYEQAERFWRKNIYSDNVTFQEQALSGLLMTAIKLDNSEIFDEFVFDIYELRRVPAKDLIVEASKYQIMRENDHSAIQLLNDYISRYYSEGDADWAYYTLGTLHEKNGPERDIQKARYYYNVVHQDFPASDYWEKAKERIEYINRNFLRVR